jgi:hypothetical protein
MPARFKDLCLDVHRGVLTDPEGNEFCVFLA